MNPWDIFWAVAGWTALVCLSAVLLLVVWGVLIAVGRAVRDTFRK